MLKLKVTVVTVVGGQNRETILLMTDLSMEMTGLQTVHGESSKRGHHDSMF